STSTTSTTTSAARSPKRPPAGAAGSDKVSRMSSSRSRIANLVRGALIGAVEAVPGVSGGTVALVTGVYETLIGSAGHLVSGAKALPFDRAAARAEFRQVKWGVLIPLAV